MKQPPAARSPFAALTGREQMEQWIVWQSQHDATRPVEETTLASQLPEPEMRRHAPQPAIPRPPHHGQYDAVIRRMNNARQHAVIYVNAAQSASDPS